MNYEAIQYNYVGLLEDETSHKVIMDFIRGHIKFASFIFYLNVLMYLFLFFMHACYCRTNSGISLASLAGL